MSGNNNRKIFDNLVSRTKIYLVIILILLLIVAYLEHKMIIPGIIIYALVLGYTYFANNKRKSEISEQLQDLTLTVDSAAKSSLINAPFPLVILETDGNIVWKSSKFITEFANIDINNYINDLIIDIKNEIRENIIKRDKLQEDAGFYKLSPSTIVIDVTNCKSAQESTKLVLEKINLLETV